MFYFLSEKFRGIFRMITAATNESPKNSSVEIDRQSHSTVDTAECVDSKEASKVEEAETSNAGGSEKLESKNDEEQVNTTKLADQPKNTSVTEILQKCEEKEAIKDKKIPEEKISIFNFKRFQNNEDGKSSIITKADSQPLIKLNKSNDEEHIVEARTNEENFFDIGLIRLMELDSEVQKWEVLCSGELTLNKIGVQKNLQFVVRDKFLRNIVFQAIIMENRQELEVKSLVKSSSIKLAMCPVDMKNNKTKPVRLYAVQSQLQKVEYLKQLLVELMEWNDEQKEVDEAYDKFIDGIEEGKEKKI